MQVVFNGSIEKTLTQESLSLLYVRENKRYQSLQDNTLKQQAWRAIEALAKMMETVKLARVER